MTVFVALMMMSRAGVCLMAMPPISPRSLPSLFSVLLERITISLLSSCGLTAVAGGDDYDSLLGIDDDVEGRCMFDGDAANLSSITSIFVFSSFRTI